MLVDLFPDSVAVVIEQDPANCLALSRDEQNLLSESSSTKRRDSFLLGRSAAKKALLQLELECKTILRDTEGSPVFPDGFHGSISHTESLAIAAATRSSDHSCIGVDVELLKRTRDPKIQTKIASVKEQEWIQSNSSSEQLRIIQLFSAKESIYKAYYSLCGDKLSWMDAELAWNEDKSHFKATVSTASGVLVTKVYVVSTPTVVFTGTLLENYD